jgi:hypothetical protein
MFCHVEIKIATQGVSCVLPMHITAPVELPLPVLFTLPNQLPMVALVSLKFLYSFLYSKHINLIEVFDFLPLPYPSLAQPPLSVTCVP